MLFVTNRIVGCHALQHIRLYCLPMSHKLKSKDFEEAELVVAAIAGWSMTYSIDSTASRTKNTTILQLYYCNMSTRFLLKFDFIAILQQ